MKGLNKVELIGRLGHDPEMRYTPNGQAVCNFSMATGRTYTSNGEKITETEWHNITAWGKLAEIVNQYVKKGSKVLVEGRLTPDAASGGPRIWTDQSGNPRASFEVTASTVRFLSSKGESSGGSEGGEAGFVGAPSEDDIPF